MLPRYVEAPIDKNLEHTVPADTAVVRTKALPATVTRNFGLGSLAFRALPFLWKSGTRLLQEQPFELIYFSTTMFPVLILGPHWKRRFGIPYVVDFQDPWLTNYYARPERPKPPGGKLKHSFHMSIARRWERRVMEEVAHTIVVSPAYATMLRDRYRWLTPESITVLPFGSAENDFELLPSLKVRQRLFERGDGMKHWVYIGRGGGDMAQALTFLFRAVANARERQPEIWSKLRMHFAGTDYAPSGQGRQTILPLAIEAGVGDLVSEITDRLPYFETLQALVEADALLIIGSDSPSYTPSKLYPYILARRPMLAIVHADSAALETLKRSHAAEVVTFDPGVLSAPDSIGSALTGLISSDGGSPATDWDYFARYSARAMTEQQSAVFNRAAARTQS